MLVKIFDIRTRRKRFITRTSKNYAPNYYIILQIIQNPHQISPHLIRNRVALVWPVECDRCYGACIVYEYLFVHCLGSD